MIIISKFLIPRGFVGITIYPFVFLKSKELKKDVILINHEKIHLQQQLELLIVFFYLFYLIEWFIKLIYYRNWTIAYKNLSFEKEAYENENNFNYTKERKKYAFLNYF